MSRRAPYAFTCRRCLRCCRHKKIQVNPYEVAQLAAHVGVTTSVFIRRHTIEGGSFLRFGDDGACPFLTEKGCGVHESRPLVCRLYPLGRHVADSGEEWFAELQGEPGCEGTRLGKSSVLQYLSEQGAWPFMRAADLYLDLYWRLSAALESERKSCLLRGAADLSWTDLDAAVGCFCRERRCREPVSLDDRMAIHICAIETWAQLPSKGG